MKHLALLSVFAPLVGCAFPAQVPSDELPPPPPPSAMVVVPPTPVRMLFTAEQLDVLLGPIALYPDALVALILPASTNSADLVAAARYLQGGGDPNQVEAQPWEDSVRSLAHYPQLIRWMDENIVWTNQLGDAFEAQPADVMNAVQRLRARARAAGTLVSTPQQQVVYDGTTILIVPTQPDIIYIPYYDPAVVYVPRYDYSPRSYFGFSSGFAVGWWMAYGLDWGDRRVWTIHRDARERYWHEHRSDWTRPSWSHDSHQRRPEMETWHPRPNTVPHRAPNPGNFARRDSSGGWQRPSQTDRGYDDRTHRDENVTRGSWAASNEQRARVAEENRRTRPQGVGPSPSAPPPPRPSSVGPGPASASPTPTFTPPPSAPLSVPPSATYDRNRGERGDRGDRGRSNGHSGDAGRFSAPPPSPAPAVGPTPPPNYNPGRMPAPPPAQFGMPVQPAYTPPSHRSAPPPPAPAAAPQAQPPPQNQPPPADKDDDDRRRSPFVHPH